MATPTHRERTRINSSRLCLRIAHINDITGQTSRVVWELGPGDVPLEALRAAVDNSEFTLRDNVLEQVSGADLDASSVTVMRLLAEAGVGVRAVRRGIGLEQHFLDATA